MRKEVNKTILNIKLIIAIMIVITIAFGMSYAYYSFKGRVKYTITIGNSTMSFNSTLLNISNGSFDVSMLEYQNTTIDGTNIGYLENTIGTVNLKLSKGSSTTPVSCGYEVWYYGDSFIHAYNGIYLEGYAASAGNYTSSNIFKYDVSGANSGWKKVYESRMQESSMDLRFVYRIYNTGVSQEYPNPGALKGRIQLMSKGCNEDDIIYTSTKGGSTANLVASNDQNIWPTTGTSGTYKLSSTYNNSTITATSSNSSILTVSYTNSTKTLVLNKVGPGSAYFDLNSTNGGFTRIFLPDDFALYPNNTMRINDYTYPMYKASSFSINGTTYGNISNTSTNQSVAKSSDLLTTRVKNAIGSTSSYTYNGTTYNMGYRYKGSDPNNYIWFNNEKWRIIGYVPVEINGTTTNLIKIARGDTIIPLQTCAWDDDDIHNFLNNYYYSYNETTGIYGKKYGSTDRIDLYTTDKYIKDPFSYSIVKKVDWYYWSSYDNNVQNFLYDRFVSNNYITYHGSYYVGTVDMVDYIYSATTVGSTFTKENNWLALYDNPYVFLPEHSIIGRIIASNVTNITSVFCDIIPTVHLENGLYVISGDGSYKNPYTVSLTEW